jgi:uncharacterized protein (TIGR00369 family)
MSTLFVPANPLFETVVRESFARQAMMATIGAHLAVVRPGEVHIALAHSPSLTQQNGHVHAGAIASIADSACGYAAFTLAPVDTDVLAVEFKISLISPARAPSFVAKGRVLRSGRTLSVCIADVFGVSGDGEVLVATMLSTIITRAVTASPLSGAH